MAEKKGDFGEPWEVECYGDHSAEITKQDGEPVWSMLDELDFPDMERIVECVNALAGYNPAGIGDVVAFVRYMAKRGCEEITEEWTKTCLDEGEAWRMCPSCEAKGFLANLEKTDD
jgi:hypothetical protein